MANKLKVQIPEEVLDYSHRYWDIEEHMNEVKVWELLLDRTKLKFLLESIDLVIIPRSEDRECTDKAYEYSEWADIWIR